jgi:outer membrane biosynthesis protein TonB
LNNKITSRGVPLSRLFAAVAAVVAVFVAGLGVVAHAQDTQRRTDSTPDEAPEPMAPAPTEPPNEPDADAPSQPLSAPERPVPPDAAPRHAKPAETSAPAPKPAKPSTPKHAKPDATKPGEVKAGDKGPFADAEGDGKHLDDLLGYVLRDNVLPLGGRSDVPLQLNSPAR